MRVLRSLMYFGAMSLGSVVASQEACPGGTQVGQNCGGGYCVPICAYDESPQQQAPQRVVERWEVFDDRFGAFAIEADTGAMGWSFGELSAAEAEQKAIFSCEQKGGQRCESLGAFRNTCATFAWGGGRGAVDGDRDPQESKRKALEYCRRESGVSCDVIQTVCSRSVSRWVYTKPDNWQPAE